MMEPNQGIEMLKKKLREIALAIAAMLGLILFGLLFFGLAMMSRPPCQNVVHVEGLEMPFCPDKPKWILPGE